MMQIISVALAVLHAVGNTNLARADKNLYADTGVLKSKILKKNTNFSKKNLKLQLLASSAMCICDQQVMAVINSL